MVLIDLATVYEQHGDGAELKRLAKRVPTFASWADLPETLAPLKLLQKAAAAEQVDRALLDRIATNMQRSPIVFAPRPGCLGRSAVLCF